jgi:hypothetical protein
MAASYGLSTLINDSSLKCFLDASNPNSYDATENYFKYSQDFTQTVQWTPTNGTITANAAIAPDGTLTATSFLETVTNGAHYIESPITSVSGITYTRSVYLKYNGRQYVALNFYDNATLLTYVDLINGTIVSTPGGVTSSIFNAGNGWYRISLTKTVTATTLYFGIETISVYPTDVFVGDITRGYFIWGSQVERGSIASAYTLTGATNKVRGAVWTDLSGNGKNITWSNTVNQFAVSNNATRGIPHFRTFLNRGDGANSNTFGITNTTGYTIFMGFMETGITGSYGFQFTDTVASRGIWTHLIWSDGNVYFDQGGCCGSDTRISSPFTETYIKFNIITFRRSAVERSIFKNGTQLVQTIETPASINLSSVTMSIGSDGGWQGMVNAFLVYNRALSNAEIARVAAGFKSRYGVT